MTAHSTWDWKSYSLVLVEGGTLVASGRGVLDMGALEVRGFALDVGRNEGASLTAQA